jgi:glycerol-3-phosphate dehydrogenase
MYVEAEDGRPYFIVPWNDLYLIGTTDTRYEGDLDHVVATDEEIDYLIEATNEVIPEAHLDRAAVIYTYAGVRPLPEAHADEGSVTRRHIIHDHAPVLEGLLSIVGGKLTTYRNLSEATADAVFNKLGRDSPGCRTSALPLPGGAVADWPAFRDEFVGASSLPRASAERLLRIYGVRAEDVLAAADPSPELLEPFDHATGAIGAEVAHAVQAELASNLSDVLLRRTMVALGPTAGIGPDERAARIAGWDDGEVTHFREQLRDMRPHAISR